MSEPQGAPLLVLYASQTGNAQVRLMQQRLQCGTLRQRQELRMRRRRRCSAAAAACSLSPSPWRRMWRSESGARPCGGTMQHVCFLPTRTCHLWRRCHPSQRSCLWPRRPARATLPTTCASCGGSCCARACLQTRWVACAVPCLGWATQGACVRLGARAGRPRRAVSLLHLHWTACLIACLLALQQLPSPPPAPPPPPPPPTLQLPQV